MDKEKEDKNLGEIFQGIGDKKLIQREKGWGLPFRSLVAVFLIGGIGGAIFSYGLFYLALQKNMNSISGVTNNITENVTVEEGSAVIDAVDGISQSVVSITTTSLMQNFYGGVVKQKGGGTGFIITNNGLIATNKHVIDGVSDLKVITRDGEYYDGKVVAIDPLFDIALVKIEASGLPVVEIGDSDDLKIGQRAIAIGNALGEYQNSVTVGVISGRARAITASDNSGRASKMEGLIQTDAPINPGNSGGPLINIRGQVVGINTAVDTQANSIGFAIPINSAKVAFDSYIENKKIVRPFIGIRYVNITRELAAANNMDITQGALITSAGKPGVLAIVPGGPADKAGLEINDIVTKIAGEEITENIGIISILSKYKPGEELEVVYIREGEEKKTAVVLGELD